MASRPKSNRWKPNFIRTAEETHLLDELSMYRGLVSAVNAKLGITPDVSKGGDKVEMDRAALREWCHPTDKRTP